MAIIAPRVLVADDNVQVLSLVESILRSAGYEVVACEGGVSAVEHAQAEHFDLILLDGMMPEVDGFEACEIIRGFPHHARTPVAFLTGLTDDGTFEDATEVGADEVLSKPIRRSSLLLRVRSLLRLSRLETEREDALRGRSALTTLILRDLEGPLRAVGASVAALEQAATSSAAPLGDLREAERSLRVLDRTLRTIQKDGDGSLVASREEVRPVDLLVAAAGRWAAAAAARSLELAIDPAASSELVALDGELVDAALDSCLGDALALARHRIVLSARAIALGVDLVVSDDGAGLGTARGRGLGGALCRIAARLHGGSFSVVVRGEATDAVLSLAAELEAAP
jgi:CheY-like chemotaxis protein